jgi:hypothetical protein
MITFADAPDRIPAPERAQIERVLIEAISAVRPGRKHWTVRTRSVADGSVRIYEFALGFEASRWLTLTDVDDASTRRCFARRAISCGRSGPAPCGWRNHRIWSPSRW